jgi:hypothetical protein
MIENFQSLVKLIFKGLKKSSLVILKTEILKFYIFKT